MKDWEGEVVGSNGDRTMMGDKEELVSLPTINPRVERLTQPSCALGDGVEDRLDVRR